MSDMLFHSAYKAETWRVKDFIDAVLHKPYASRGSIAIPPFQRSQTWKPVKMCLLLDSMRRGYPFGCALLGKTGNNANGSDHYILLDGLQRALALVDFQKNPFRFMNHDEILGLVTPRDWQILENCEYFEVPRELFTPALLYILTGDRGLLDGVPAALVPEEGKLCFSPDEEFAPRRFLSYVDTMLRMLYRHLLHDANAPAHDFDIFLTNIKDQGWLQGISDVVAAIEAIDFPVIVITRLDGCDLEEVFERVNAAGVALTKWQVFAATSHSSHRLELSPRDVDALKPILEHLGRRFVSVTDRGLHEQEARDVATVTDISAYDLIFSLGGWLLETYPSLFSGASAEAVGGNLLSTCLRKDAIEIGVPNSSSADLMVLQQLVYGMSRTPGRLASFIAALIEAVGDVNRVLYHAKGGSDKESVIGTTVFVFVSIGTWFRNKYDWESFKLVQDWRAIQMELANNLRRWQVRIAIPKEWNEGGLGRRLYILRENTFLREQISDDLLKQVVATELARQRTKRTKCKRGHTPKDALTKLIQVTTVTQDDYRRSAYHLDHIIPLKQLEQICTTEKVELAGNVASNKAYIPGRLNQKKRDHPLFDVFESVALDEIQQQKLLKSMVLNQDLLELTANIQTEKDYEYFLDERDKLLVEELVRHIP